MTSDLAMTVFNLKTGLMPDCARIETAGSIRRGKEDPRDIEMVCIPRLAVFEQRNLFGEVTSRTIVNHLELFGIPALLASGAWTYDTENKKNGPDYKRLRHISGIALDLFITTPEKWGVIFTLRTGPAGFSKALVTLALQQRKHVTDGRLHNHTKGQKQERGGATVEVPCDKGDRCPLIVATPEEADLFKALGLPYMEPVTRTTDTLRKIVAKRSRP